MAAHTLIQMSPWMLPPQTLMQCQRCGAKLYFNCDTEKMRQLGEEAEAMFVDRFPECSAQPAENEISEKGIQACLNTS